MPRTKPHRMAGPRRGHARRREKLGEALARERRLYHTILSNTPDLVYVFGLDHRFLYANQALLKMWGKTWEEAVGRNCLELGYPAWHAAMHDRELDQVIATRKPVRGEAPFTGTGGRRIYDYIFSPVIADNGAVEAIAGIARDVTELRDRASRLAALVASRTTELKGSVEELERFTYTVAHDLRAPLRAVHRWAELLRAGREALSARDQDEHLRRIESGVEKMDLLIRDLLDYSRIGRSDVRREPLSLRSAAREALDSLALQIREARAVIRPLPEADQRLLTDHVLLSQILSNLLSNAIKFTPPDRSPVVEVGWERSGRVVRLWVEDNGIGIEPQYRERVFEVFERLHGRDVYQGTGIGLAIVKRAVERLGGQVGFDSVPGNGCRFWVTLEGAA